MRWAVLFSLLSLAFAAGPGDPEYGRYRVANIDSRIGKLAELKLPFVEVVDTKAFEGCRDKTGSDYYNCVQSTTWKVPYSTLAATEEKARELRLAWQRFEERYYWHTITRLNNPALYVAYCWVGLRGGALNPPRVDARLSVDLGSIPSQVPGDQEYRQRLLNVLGAKAPASAGLHSLDMYYPLPQVPKEDFCDNLSLQLLPIMYIPGFCLSIQQIGFSWCTPGYDEDQPLWFNEDEAQRRVNDAITHAISRYYTDYQADVARVAATPVLPASVDPRNWHVYAPFLWKTQLLGGGAVVAPVLKDLKNPADMASSILQEVQSINSVVMQARSTLPATAQPLLTSYYGQSLMGLANYPGLSSLKNNLSGLIGGLDQAALSTARTTLAATDVAEKLQNRRGFFRNEVKTGAPGAFVFEESKRWFPLGSLPVQEKFGYTTWFTVWNQTEATVIPTPKDAMGAFGLLQRTLIYWWIPVRVTMTFIPTPPFVQIAGSLDIPKPKPIPPYALPFAAERTYWAWENVPEGYPIPKVKGSPALPNGFGYGILLR